MKTIKKKTHNLNFDLINKSDKVFIVSNKQLKIKKKILLYSKIITLLNLKT